MKENSWVYDEYENIVKEQLKSNIVEECSSSFSFYMPHSPVVQSDRETMLKFDWYSMRQGCKSLSDCLHAGPALNPTVLGFREHEYAFSCDVQGAFLTIGIAKEDRDYLRFLWFPDEDDTKPYKILRMTRVQWHQVLLHLQRPLNFTPRFIWMTK